MVCELSFSDLSFHLYKMGVILELMAELTALWHVEQLGWWLSCNKYSIIELSGTSLVIQRLRICLAMQWVGIWSMVRELSKIPHWDN